MDLALDQGMYGRSGHGVSALLVALQCAMRIGTCLRELQSHWCNKMTNNKWASHRECMQMRGKLHAGCGVDMQVLYCLCYSSQATDLANVHGAAMPPDSPQGHTALVCWSYQCGNSHVHHALATVPMPSAGMHCPAQHIIVGPRDASG